MLLKDQPKVCIGRVILTPLVLLSKAVGYSEVDGKCHVEAEDIGLEFLSQGFPSTSLLVELRRIHRYNSVDATHAESHNDPTYKHDRHRAPFIPQPGDKHQEVAQCGDRQTSEDAGLSAAFVCEQTREDSSDGAPKIVYGNDNTDHRVFLCDAHRIQVVIVGVDQGHHALVVAIEGNGRGGEDDHLGLLVPQILPDPRHLGEQSSSDLQRIDFCNQRSRKRLGNLLSQAQNTRSRNNDWGTTDIRSRKTEKTVSTLTHDSEDSDGQK